MRGEWGKQHGKFKNCKEPQQKKTQHLFNRRKEWSTEKTLHCSQILNKTFEIQGKHSNVLLTCFFVNVKKRNGKILQIFPLFFDLYLFYSSKLKRNLKSFCKSTLLANTMFFFFSKFDQQALVFSKSPEHTRFSLFWFDLRASWFSHNFLIYKSQDRVPLQE